PAASTPNGTTFENPAAAQADEVPAPVSDSGSAAVSTSADLAASVSAPATVKAGSGLDYTITTSNSGPSDDTSVSLTDPLPAGTTFQRITGPAGWTCRGQAGTVTCSHAGSYHAGASDTFELTVGTDPNLAASTVITDGVSIAGDASDPNPTNNAASANTTV